MSEPDFGAVDEYIVELLVEDDPALKPRSRRAKRQDCRESTSRPIKASS